METNRKIKLSGEDLLAIGFVQGSVLGNFIRAVNENNIAGSKAETLALAADFLKDPSGYLEHATLKEVATELIISLNPVSSVIPLNDSSCAYSVFGPEQIEEGAISQMEVAMKLPVTVAGSLMPDAHQGYGLPIGGVLATNNAVIPYGVGVDIGCRMALSVFDIDENYFHEKHSLFQRELIAWTSFGAGASWKGSMKAEHSVLDKDEFGATTFIKNLHEKAASQLGTSGGGNHFVEFGIINFENDDLELNIRKGNYVALLTHSGSRGFGATIAGHYTRLAKEICKLPKEAANLAYLDLNSAEGQEYWLAMNLAGDYASACHEIIHQRLTKAIGGEVLARVENHHNFAWKEQLNGKQVIVHRKGATPASNGVMGIIPGSMTASGYLVRGKGNAISINSASHGAGRQMSRTKAINSITRSDMQKILKDHGVKLIGAGLDEAPMAYKDIEKVMAAQTELVDVVARFTPKIVRMADDGSRED